jgi:hypothetical protein
VSVAAQPECVWTATAEGAWISGLAPITGQGAGRVDFQAAANPAPTTREATIDLNGQKVVVQQQGTPCHFSVTPPTRAVDARAGSASVTVDAAAGCGWTAAGGAAWLNVTAGAAGSGAGSVTYEFTANAGDTRTATLTVAGQAVIITQAAGNSTQPNCQFQVNPTTLNAPSVGANVTTAVSAPSGCAWTVTVNDPWISATASQTSGSGTVTLALDPNPAATRTTTLIVAGQVVAVTQAGSCALSVAPTAQSIAAAGGSTTVSVSVAAGCPWSAVSNDSWLALPFGAGGSGTGSLVVMAAANSGAPRTGTVSIGGQVFTVNQAGGCAASINPTSQSVASTGGAGASIDVAVAAGCAWTAVSNAPWLTVSTGASGNGNGTVTFAAGANSGSARIGTITIAAQTFTVTQAGGCAASINPSSQSIGSSGGAGTAVAVTAGTGCAWTAASNDSWLTISSGASGSGNGSVAFTVAANASSARTGTMLIAGQTFTVTQAGACTFGITPTSQSIGAGGGTGSAITVTGAAGCAWSASNNDPWITVTSGTSGTGNGTVAFTVAANSGPARVGTLTVAGKTFTVNQGGGCTFGVAPTSQTFAQAGGSGGPVTVTAATGCTWTGTTTDTWISVTAGASGSGNGSVTFSVAANAGAPRTGSLTIAGQPFAVTQGGTCSFTVNPLSVTGLAPTGGPGPNLTVSAAGGCSWTAVSNDSWITVTAGSAGTGNGTVSYTVAANAGGARTGTLTVAGQTVSISQLKH